MIERALFRQFVVLVNPDFRNGRPNKKQTLASTSALGTCLQMQGQG
jgi:hypothetical protein